jgi:signal transduction histidine kinase
MIRGDTVHLRKKLLESKTMAGARNETNTLSVDNLLTIFRIASISRFVIALIFYLVLSTTVGKQNLGRLLAVMDALLLAIYLSADPLRRLLGGRYLPIALLWAAITPLLTSLYTMYFFYSTPISGLRQEPIEQVANFVVLSNIAQTLAILLIPLVIVSWRYTRRSVIQFCVGTSVLDSALIILFVPLNEANLAVALSSIVFRLVILLLVGLMVNLLVTVQRTQAQALHDANARLRDYAATREQLITSQERNRLARELHDTLAHTLAAAAVQLEAVQVIWETQPARARQLVEESAVTMRGGLQDTRRALQALRAEPLESVGFVASIQLLAESIQARYKVNTTIETPDDVLWLTQEQEHVIYRVAQEALLNSAQHAHAQQIRIKVEETGGALHLTIKDNGTGFDPSAVDVSAHFGVQGMRERAAMIGAELTVSSRVGQGTQVEMLLHREPSENSNL